MAFNQLQIDILRDKFGAINKVVDVHSEGYRNLIRVLDRCEVDELCSLESANIKYVSALARNRLARKGIYR